MGIKESDLVNDLKTALKNLDQGSLFGTDSLSAALESACSAYLKFRGYRVVLPKKFVWNIKTNDDLIRFFYNNMNSRYPERYMYSFNVSRERATAKEFIDNRMGATGASRDYTLNECAEIIQTIFDHEKEFNFSFGIQFYMFGNIKFQWVIDKALVILHKERLKLSEERAEAMSKAAMAEMDISDIGYNDLDELLNKMEENE